jgi:hypothetical protein
MPYSTAEAGWFKNLISSIVSTSLGLPTPSNQVIAALTPILNLLTGCSSGSTDGVQTQCFDSTESAKINSAIKILKARQYLVDRGGAVDPYSQFRAHTSILINWDSAQTKMTYLVGYVAGCNADNAWACHVIDNSTFLTASGLALDPVNLAAILSHEGDHYNKTHNCGDAADADLSGPYGLEALYSMSLYRNAIPQVTAGQQSLAYSRAVSIANYQLCSNTAARDAVLNYTNRAALAVAPITPAPPSGSVPACKMASICP